MSNIHIDDLPDEIQLNILSCLTPESQARMGVVCRKYRNLVNDSTLSLGILRSKYGIVTANAIVRSGMPLHLFLHDETWWPKYNAILKEYPDDTLINVTDNTLNLISDMIGETHKKASKTGTRNIKYKYNKDGSVVLTVRVDGKITIPSHLVKSLFVLIHLQPKSAINFARVLSIFDIRDIDSTKYHLIKGTMNLTRSNSPNNIVKVMGDDLYKLHPSSRHNVMKNHYIQDHLKDNRITDWNEVASLMLAYVELGNLEISTTRLAGLIALYRASLERPAMLQDSKYDKLHHYLSVF